MSPLDLLFHEVLTMNINENNELYQEEQELQLQDYIYVILKRKEIILIFLLIVFISTIIFSLIQKPQYKSTAVLEIKPERIQIVEDVSGQAYYSTSFETLLNTQVKILQSRGLAKLVVSRLNLLPRTDDLSKNKNPDSQIKTDYKNETDKLQILIDSLLKSLEVKMIRNTRLIEVSFTTPDAQLSAALANSWVENFIQMSASAETLTDRTTNIFINEQINKLQNEIAEKEAKLRTLSQNNEIVIMDEKLNIAMKNLSQLNTSLFDAQTEHFNKESYYNKIKNSPPNALPEVFNNPIIQNLENEYNKLEKDYNEKAKIFKPQWPEMQRLQDQLAKAKDKLTQEKNKIYQNIFDSAKAEYLSALQKEEKIKYEFNQQKNEAMKLNESAITYNSLRAEIENQKKLMDSLLKKREETSISAEMQLQTQNNIRIIDQAEVAKNPVKPNIKLNLLLALLIGLFGGFALAFFIDYLDDKIKSIDDIEHYIKLPLLGLIPLHSSSRHHHKNLTNKSDELKKDKKKSFFNNILEQTGIKTPLETISQSDGISYLITHNNPKGTIAEAFRVIRTAILLSPSSAKAKCLLVTSAQPKEGKTFISTNLAICLSQINKKVALLDCDLRNPVLHKIFKVNNSIGITSFLTQQNKINEIYIKTPINNLSIITAGSRAHKPAELLSLPTFNDLIEKLKQEFDFIIIDTAPIIPIADTAIIAPYSDAILLVLLNEGTARKSAQHAIQRLQAINCPILGCVLNSVDLEDRSYYYYRYYNYSYYNSQ